MHSLAYVLPDFRSFSTVDYVAYGFNIPMNQLCQDLTVCLAYVAGAVRHRILLPADARGGQMTERTSFYRKIAYGVAIVVLAVRHRRGSARRRPPRKKAASSPSCATSISLAQANLGEIDPASETIKLATLGLRGVAVNVLWDKANYYKKIEDWTNLTATLEQLAKLQPNFITFWKFQAWNLTYNVSVEFDDYRDRYYYVRRGIKFLKEGEHYNGDNPQLLWDLGWFIGQKIGRADEHVQYRRLFKEDDDFHPADRTLDERDNWLVGKEWYLTGDRRGGQQGQEPRPQEPARSSIPARPSRR